MKKILSFLVLSFSLLVLSDCKDGNDPVAKITPSNLVVEATISTDGSGLVSFVATADDAVKFEFYFGENLAALALTSTDGTESNIYQNTGTYNVKVLAYSVDNLSIDKTIPVTIQVNEPIISDVGYSTPDSYVGKTLVWNDEFEGTELNLSDWTHEQGNGQGGWGNNELQFYQSANTSVHDGYLVIKAKRESESGFQYTSSRIITKGKKEFKYGRVDIRAILPKGQGIWPALWMLGSNIADVSWPKCGEIDIMEMVGGGADRDNKVYGTVHWDNAGSYASYGGNKTITAPKVFADEFHVFSIVWDETKIVWYLDDVQFHIIDITPPELNEFQKNFFFIFNVAVGGNWPGSPNTSTTFPQRMTVDYIRVFQ